MEKKIAKTDMTYCVNNKCKQKEDCFRYKGNYYFDGSLFYSFDEFAEDYCNKGVSNEFTRITRTNNK